MNLPDSEEMDEEALAEFLYVFDLVRKDVAHLGKPKSKYTNVDVRVYSFLTTF